MRVMPLVIAVGWLALPAGGQATARPSAAELAQALQRHYDRVRDFTADFVHDYEGGALRMTASERGVVLIKKPGRMRWHYEAPEEKLFVSDGRTLYSYLPRDHQVRVDPMPTGDQAAASVLFLAGKGNFTRDFEARYADLPDTPPDAYALTFTPVRSQPDYESLTLVVDRRTLELRRLISHDSQGGTSTFRFTNLKANVGLSDGLFAFTIPRDADVIRSDGAAR